MLEVPAVDDPDQPRPARQYQQDDKRRDIRQVVERKPAEAGRDRAAGAVLAVVFLDGAGAVALAAVVLVAWVAGCVWAFRASAPLT